MSTTTDNDRISRATRVLAAGRVPGLVVAFAIPLVLARVFDQTEFGTYKQLFLIYATLFGLAQLGMAESLYYFVPLCPAQVVPSQHAGLFGPHAAPSAPQLQNCAAAQKPLVLFEKGTQQPVSHCALVVQFGRQPEYSGFVDSTHEPRQQSFGVVLVPGVQVSARRLQGFVHASSSAQTSTPVS